MSESKLSRATDVLDRFSPDLVNLNLQSQFETLIKDLDHMVLSDSQGKLFVDEELFRKGLSDGLGLSKSEVDELVKQEGKLFTDNTVGLSPVKLADLPKVSLPTGQTYEQLGLKIHSTHEEMRTAFGNAYKSANKVIDWTADDIRNAAHDGLVQKTTTGYAFLRCLQNMIAPALVSLAMHALAAIGVYVGVIVIVGVTMACAFWFLAATFGLSIAVIVIDCLVSAH